MTTSRAVFETARPVGLKTDRYEPPEGRLARPSVRTERRTFTSASAC
jgi:hypothetical protein